MRSERKPLGSVAYLGGIPAVYEEFTIALAQLVQFNCWYMEDKDNFIYYFRTKRSFHADARNDLARDFLGDWLYMADCDNPMEPDTVLRLAACAHRSGCGVVSGVYVSKLWPFNPVLCIWNQELPSPLGSWQDEPPAFEIGCTGGGGLFVRRWVFDRIRKELGEEPFSIRDGLSEDYSFFKRLKLLGIKALVDMRVEIPHLTTTPLWLGDYERDSVRVGPDLNAPGLAHR